MEDLDHSFVVITADYLNALRSGPIWSKQKSLGKMIYCENTLMQNFMKIGQVVWPSAL